MAKRKSATTTNGDPSGAGKRQRTTGGVRPKLKNRRIDWRDKSACARELGIDIETFNRILHDVFFQVEAHVVYRTGSYKNAVAAVIGTALDRGTHTFPRIGSSRRRNVHDNAFACKGVLVCPQVVAVVPAFQAQSMLSQGEKGVLAWFLVRNFVDGLIQGGGTLRTTRNRSSKKHATTSQASVTDQIHRQILGVKPASEVASRINDLLGWADGAAGRPFRKLRGWRPDMVEMWMFKHDMIQMNDWLHSQEVEMRGSAGGVRKNRLRLVGRSSSPVSAAGKGDGEMDDNNDTDGTHDGDDGEDNRHDGVEEIGEEDGDAVVGDTSVTPEELLVAISNQDLSMISEQALRGRALEPSMPYEDACDLLGFTTPALRSRPTLGQIVNIDSTSGEETPSPLDPHQVIMLAKHVESERRQLAYVNAACCGMGKTRVALALVAFQASQDLQPEPIGVFAGLARGPTLVVAPAATIMSWYHEINNHVSKDANSLEVHFDVAIKGELQVTEDELQEIFDREDARNVIVLTSYETYGQRAKRRMPILSAVQGKEDANRIRTKKDARPAQGATGPHRHRRRFARIICDEVHKMKGAIGTAAIINGLQAPYRTGLSATPVPNSCRDLVGLAVFLSELRHESPGEWSTDMTLNMDPGVVSRVCRAVEKSTAGPEQKIALARYTRLLESRVFRMTWETRIMPVGGLGGKEDAAVDGARSSIPRTEVTTIRSTYGTREFAIAQQFANELAPLLTGLGGRRQAGGSGTGTVNAGVFKALWTAASNGTFFQGVNLSGDKGAARVGCRPADAGTVSSWVKGDCNIHDYAAHLDGRYQTADRSKVDILLELLRFNPKLLELLRIVVHHVCDQDERMVVYGHWPETLFVLKVYFAELGVASELFSTDKNRRTRANIVRRFNDPTCGLRLLFCSYNVCALGINLHHACHTMVLFELGINQAIEEQAIGRLRRLGQQLPQRVYRLSTAASFDEWLEVNQTLKNRAWTHALREVASLEAAEDAPGEEMRVADGFSEDQLQAFRSQKAGYMQSSRAWVREFSARRKGKPSGKESKKESEKESEKESGKN